MHYSGLWSPSISFTFLLGSRSWQNPRKIQEPAPYFSMAKINIVLNCKSKKNHHIWTMGFIFRLLTTKIICLYFICNLECILDLYWFGMDAWDWSHAHFHKHISKRKGKEKKPDPTVSHIQYGRQVKLTVSDHMTANINTSPFTASLHLLGCLIETLVKLLATCSAF